MCQTLQQGRKRSQYLQNKELMAFFSRLLRYDNSTAKNNKQQELEKINCSFS